MRNCGSCGARAARVGRRLAAAFRGGPTPTRDVKTRTPRSVGTCDRLQRPRRLPSPRSARPAAGCGPRAPSWVGGARAEAEPGRSQRTPRHRKRKRRPGRKGGACAGPRPRPARCWTSWRAQVGGRRARSADPRGERRGRHHVAGRCGGRRWLQGGWGPARDAREGPGPRTGFRSFWVLHPKPTPSPGLALVPSSERRVTAIAPGRDAASSTKSGGSRVKGQRPGVTCPTSSQAWDALPSPHPPPVTVGTLAFSGKCPGGMGWGCEGQNQGSSSGREKDA